MQYVLMVSLFTFLIGLFMTISSIYLYRLSYLNMVYSRLIAKGYIYVRVTMVGDIKSKKVQEYFGWALKNEVLGFKTTYKDKGVWMFSIVNTGSDYVPVDKIDFFTELGSAKLVSQYGGFKKDILVKLPIS